MQLAAVVEFMELLYNSMLQKAKKKYTFQLTNYYTASSMHVYSSFNADLLPTSLAVHRVAAVRLWELYSPLMKHYQSWPSVLATPVGAHIFFSSIPYKTTVVHIIFAARKL